MLLEILIYNQIIHVKVNLQFWDFALSFSHRIINNRFMLLFQYFQFKPIHVYAIILLARGLQSCITNQRSLQKANEQVTFESFDTIIFLDHLTTQTFSTSNILGFTIFENNFLSSYYIELQIKLKRFSLFIYLILISKGKV